jgi:hypothetical protein
MKSKVLILTLILSICCAGLAVADGNSAFPWAVSYNKDGQLNLYGAVGLYGFWGVEASAGAEMILGQFDIAGIPLDWGVAARAIVNLPLFTGYGFWIDWGAAPMATLHLGTDFGGIWKFEWYIGLGLGLYGSTSTYSGWWSPPFGIGFGTVDGVAWRMTDNLSIIVDYAYIGTSSYGIGVELKL